MSQEQLERTRMQKARESLGSSLSDARNYLNRFFGAKVCGKCEGCSGGSCDSCKGKPVVSLWDAASPAPAVEEAMEKPSAAAPERAAQEKAAPDTPFQLPMQQSENPLRQSETTLRAGTAAADESRLIHLRASKPVETVFSGASLLRAGLSAEPDSGKAGPKAVAPPSAESGADLRIVAEMPSAIANSNQAEPQNGKQTPANNTMQMEAVAGPLSLRIPEGPVSEKTRVVSVKAPGTVQPEPGIRLRSDVHPASHELRPRPADTILENPCMQAILKIKYSKPANVSRSAQAAPDVKPALKPASKPADKPALKEGREAKRAIERNKPEPAPRKAGPALRKAPFDSKLDKLEEQKKAGLRENQEAEKKSEEKRDQARRMDKAPKPPASDRKRAAVHSPENLVRNSRGKGAAKELPGAKKKPKKDAGRLILLLDLLQKRRRKRRIRSAK